ncbi:hypothetical protein K8I31_04210 [bacterium]|nr:hypothetical protein [bacterium]
MNQLKENKIFHFARLTGLLAIFLVTSPFWLNFVLPDVLLRVPISLTAGSTVNKDFFVIWGNEYEIYLDFQRNKEVPGLTDFVGHGVHGPDGSPINDGVPLDIEWTLTRGGEVVATNKGKSISGTGYYWGNDNLGRKIGSFSSESLEKYSFVATVSTTAKQFELAAPHILVKRSFESIEKTFVIFSLTFVFGGILGITALFSFGIAYFQSRRVLTKE